MKVKKSEATRARILDAANRVLREKSYSEARLADIAKEAGTHAGAMYYYFASKEALVEELLNRNAERSWQHVQERVANLPSEASYRERLLTAAKAAVANVLGDTDEVIVHMRLINEIPAEMRSRLLSHARISRHFVRDLIRSGQKAGEFRADINPTVVALMLFSNLVWAYDWFKPSPTHSIDEFAHDLCHILLSGIEERAPAEKKSAARPRGVPSAGRRSRHRSRT